MKNNITIALILLMVSCIFMLGVSAGTAAETTLPVRVATLAERTGLSGPWKIKLGDDPIYASPGYDDAAWDSLKLPGSIMPYICQKTGAIHGIVWLRKSVYMSRDLSRQDIGLILGRIANADETFFNGEKIGGMGEFPPHEHSMWNHPRHYLISKSLVRYGAINVMAVRVSYYLYGEVLGELSLANLDDWKRDRNLSYFLLIILTYFQIAMGVPLFMIFLFFYLKRRESQEYLFYTLQLIFGLVIILDLSNYWNLYGSLLNRFKLLGFSWVALNVAHPIFLHRIYNLDRKKTEIFLWLALGIVLFSDVFFTNERLLRIHGLLLIVFTTQIGWYNLSCHISALHKKRPYAKLFGVFGSIVVLGAMHDGFVYFIKFAFLDANVLGPWFEYMIFYITTFFLYMGTTLVLVSRFLQMTNEVEDLNTSMETFIIENALLQDELTKSNESRRRASYPAMSDRVEEKMTKVVDFIQKNYTFDLSREGLAATVDVHPDNLGKLFKIYTNKKMGDYINELRVKDAAQRLADTDKSIIDIAFEVGFDSLRTFNRVFPKIMKLTPEKYRKNMKKT